MWSPYEKEQCDSLERVKKRAGRQACQAKWVSGKFQWGRTYDECRNEVINHLDCLVFDAFMSFNNTASRSHHFCINYIPSRTNAFDTLFFFLLMLPLFEIPNH